MVVGLFETSFSVNTGWVLAGLALLGWAAAIAAALYLRREQQARRQAAAAAAADLQAEAALQQRLAEAEQQRSQQAARLQAVLSINRSLAEAPDERSLMESALSAVTGLVGALGCSFVPVDEWQQPLPAFTFGQLPEPVLSAWSTHLATNMLRERCGSCSILKSNPGACPLHPAQLGNSLTVYCLPLDRSDEPDPAAEPTAGAATVYASGAIQAKLQDPASGHTVGVLHLYLPAGRSLDADTRQFLDGLLNEISMAYAAARLRSQERVTLRQLQMLNAPESDFSASLGGLLDGLTQALEADFLVMRLRPSADERFSNLNIQRGDPAAIPAELERLVETALSAALHGQSLASAPQALPVWQALPLMLPEANRVEPAPLGVLLVGGNRPGALHPRQQVILQAVASQAALLIENERLLRQVEYKVVIQERVRLAREIHDGLAQTLAFLKLQAAQMQTYLANGDLTRLSQVLKDNYQALAEAYLDTRQAIDNLRLTPQEGLDHWLERILSEFESTTGLRVERDIQPPARPLAPETQAQLIRIVQEALSNVRKHARASRVRVCLCERPTGQVIEISDDGRGFDAEDVPEISQHGLRGMRERAEMIGADFQVISQARQGTTLRLVLPTSLEEEPTP